jgi:hypothetical protein
MKSAKIKFNGTAFVRIDVGFKKEFSCNPETQVLIYSLLKLLLNSSSNAHKKPGSLGFGYVSY